MRHPACMLAAWAPFNAGVEPAGQQAPHGRRLLVDQQTFCPVSLAVHWVALHLWHKVAPPAVEKVCSEGGGEQAWSISSSSLIKKASMACAPGRARPAALKPEV